MAADPLLIDARDSERKIEEKENKTGAYLHLRFRQDKDHLFSFLLFVQYNFLPLHDGCLDVILISYKRPIMDIGFNPQSQI